MEIQPIAHFHSPFTSKFGIPKQSGLVAELPGTIVFVPSQRNADALRGIDDFDYLWLIWEFSANKHGATSPVVRPPVLGGNVRVGVFASRSPFRPNPLGLSSVRLDRVEWEGADGPVIHVTGADLMDGTPIYDIKPYVVYADSHPEARSGFVDHHPIQRLEVELPEGIEAFFDAQQLTALRKTLALDPRPHYHQDEQKVYGMPFGGHDIHFLVTAQGVLRVLPLT
jgi:tRNA-Thr(GGU) m(6)t(6)A37 methyltransferase TsaA